MAELIRTYPVLVLLSISFLLGGLPLIGWVVYGLTGQHLSKIGTHNVSVSAAFAHGGTTVGILAVLLEMFRGIAVVLLARSLFPHEPSWELLALIPLILGRYFIHQGAGVTNVVWGYLVHDWRVAFFVALIGGVTFTLVREKRLSRWLMLMLIPAITVLLHPYDTGELVAAVVLCLVLAMIYSRIPDDLDLSSDAVKPESRKMLGFFRGDRAFPALNQPLKVEKVGQKAATLAQLKQWGYPVPMGWVVPPGDDPEKLVQSLQLSPERPVIVRSSAIGEDSDEASAAGQYISLANITNPCALRQAIVQVQQSYLRSTAVKYRRDRHLPDTGMAVLVQRQIQGVFSGVAFSRDPITRQGDAVVIEALPGNASQVVSGRQTPEQYRVFIPTNGTEIVADSAQSAQSVQWRIPDDQTFPMEFVSGVHPPQSPLAKGGSSGPPPLQEEIRGGHQTEAPVSDGCPQGDGSSIPTGNLPPRLIQHVAYLVRHIENQYHGIPQDMEWSYDGHSLWVLQSRPITTLLPIWTRKIAAEVIPGHLRPLTWSINRPLTCGVWGDIFSVVLGPQAQAFDFQDTATLHHSVAYFNASLLGQIFRQMGLPEDSLEFLTRGAKFKRPPLLTTLKQLPGLGRLLRREWSLAQDFERDRPQFTSTLKHLADTDLSELSDSALWQRAVHIQSVLKRVTYYHILAPLSAALRQAIAKNKVQPDPSHLAEVASLRAIQALAADIRTWLQTGSEVPGTDPNDIQDWSHLATLLHQSPEGQNLLGQMDLLLETYGYLSDVATDIAVPTWKEDPSPVQGLLLQTLKHPPQKKPSDRSNPAPGMRRTPPQPSSYREGVPESSPLGKGWIQSQVQSRVNLKGDVATIYNRLLAELRWTIVALEKQWIQAKQLEQSGDIFFLTTDDIQQFFNDDPVNGDQVGVAPVNNDGGERGDRLQSFVQQRRSQWQQDQTQENPPYLIYGNDPISPISANQTNNAQNITAGTNQTEYRGIGASPGQVSGPVVTLRNLHDRSTLEPGTIIVVPYTDAGWAPLLTQASGIISEVGGSLSHGAIIAREYGIPAVMNIPNITQWLQSGRVVYLDGTQGRVTILHDKLNDKLNNNINPN